MAESSSWPVTLALILLLHSPPAVAAFHLQQAHPHLRHPQASHGQQSRALLQNLDIRLITTTPRFIRCVTFDVGGIRDYKKFYAELNARWTKFKALYPGSFLVKGKENKRYNAKRVLQIHTVLLASIVATNPTTAVTRLQQLWKFDPKRSTVQSVLYRKGVACNFYGLMPSPGSLCATYRVHLQPSAGNWTMVSRHLKCVSSALRKQVDPPRQVKWMLVQASNTTAFLQLTYGSVPGDSFTEPCDQCVKMTPRTWVGRFLSGKGPIANVTAAACLPVSELLKGKAAVNVNEWVEEKWQAKPIPVNGTVCRVASAAATKP